MDYLMDGIKNGFDVVNQGLPTAQIDVNNYSSAIKARDLVEDQIRQEIKEGRYVIVQSKPQVVSALGAIPKPDGRIRLIHDCSRPQGRAVNDFAKINSAIKYQTVQDAVKLISPGYFCAKIDLQNAYRTVKTKATHWQFTGLKWTFQGDNQPTYMVDTRLPFGARLSVECFHRLSQAIQRILARQGVRTVIYLDDILIVSTTKTECMAHMQLTLSTLRSLGFGISYKKM